MKQSARYSIVLLWIGIVSLTNTYAAQPAPSFAALVRWKAAVISPRSSALKELYSTDPAPRITVVGKTSADISAADDAEFWKAMRATQLSLKVANSTTPQPGLQQVTFQATVKTAPPGRTLYVIESQLWQQQAEEWKLVAVQRTDAFKLEQPMSLDAKLYPPASQAREEITHALAEATKTHKRVLVIFGADWCYDCHVLDRALQRPDIAPTLKRNYEVVHVDVGQGDKNQDLMNEYQVPMKRGIPAMAVLSASGQLLYSQKNGEFERARALGPEDLLEFLNKWKSS
ncbi:MAG TPA: thioredoxin family protein [Terriglobales bacterium]|nr:thioredoxin family protein [Terriglobales bacterium]